MSKHLLLSFEGKSETFAFLFIFHLLNGEVLLKDKATCLSELSDIDCKINKLKQKLDQLSSENDTLKKEKMSKRFENLEKKKSRILMKFDINFRSYIEKLDSRYHNTGVVRVLNALCPGCHMKLPTKEAGRLRNPGNFVLCSFCGRIILSCPIDTEKVTRKSFTAAQ